MDSSVVVKGLFYGDGGQFMAQITDAVVLIVFCSVMCIAFFKIVDKTVGLRSLADDEIAGLDLPEMGAMAYPDFLEAQGSVFVTAGDPITMHAENDGVAARLRTKVGA